MDNIFFSPTIYYKIIDLCLSIFLKEGGWHKREQLLKQVWQLENFFFSVYAIEIVI